MIFLCKVHHCIILKAESKAGEALAASSKSKGSDKRKKGKKTKCFNCNKLIAMDLKVEKRDKVLIKRVKRAERNCPTLQMSQISQ